MSQTATAAASAGGCGSRSLTSHDQSVLNAVFSHNPLVLEVDLLQASAAHAAVELGTGEEDFCESLDESGEPGDAVDDTNVAEARRLEARGVEAANEGALPQALELFAAAITLAPSRPSPYNNRAQALRLLHDVVGAEDDLEKAVTLSKGRGPTAVQAYTQRGLLRRLQGKEADALEDFKHAAALGGKFAKSQVVALNPYAALCGAIVAEMLERERSGPPASS